MTLDQELQLKLDDIKKVFDIKSILSLNPDRDSVKKYYRINKIPYSIFHSKTDLIHVGISRDGTFKEADLLEDAKVVENYIKKSGAKTVLELATGRGANSYYLAQKFPKARFDGVDISETQLKFAKKRAEKISNYFPVSGDYHDLRLYKDGTFNIVFEVEAVCYSAEKEKIFREVARVLKEDGLFILFDGYRKQEKEELTENEAIARSLIEKGMALQELENYESFLRKADESHFIKIQEEDLSEYVLPTMYRFEKWGARFFRHHVLAKIMVKLFPKELTHNAMSGYLMPIAVKKGIFCYMSTVFQKPKTF
jgi:ubiquinone/menaquinone biosynthesis C-methylase UbiE